MNLIKNKYIHLFRAAQKRFFNDQFTKSERNIKATRKKINQPLQRKMASLQFPWAFTYGSSSFADALKLVGSMISFQVLVLLFLTRHLMRKLIHFIIWRVLIHVWVILICQYCQVLQRFWKKSIYDRISETLKAYKITINSMCRCLDWASGAKWETQRGEEINFE